MSLRVQILAFDTGKEELLGVFFLGADGQVAYDGDVEDMLTEPMETEDFQTITATEDPEGWLRALPANRDGSYLRANLIESREAGGAGSGDRGHKGRPGEVGGSGSGGSAEKAIDALNALPEHGASDLTSEEHEAPGLRYYNAKQSPLQLGEVKSPDQAWTNEKASIESAIQSQGGFQYLVSHATQEEVNISDLHSFQTWIGPARVEAHLNSLSGKQQGPLALIFHHEGKDWICDGNHRVVSRYLAGVKKINVLRLGGKPSGTRQAASKTKWVFSTDPLLFGVDPTDPRVQEDYAERTAEFDDKGESE